jgi:hypothetical protein
VRQLACGNCLIDPVGAALSRASLNGLKASPKPDCFAVVDALSIAVCDGAASFGAVQVAIRIWARVVVFKDCNGVFLGVRVH